MSPAPDSPRPRSWLRFQFSLGTLFWLMLVVGIVIAWWKDRSSFDERLKKLEQIYAPTQQTLWGAADILGAPDDPTGGAGKSWCPAGTNVADWVIVGFDRAVPAATIDLHETYLMGCVTEVIVIDRSGKETSIWKGADPTTTATTIRTGLFAVPVPATIKSVEQVKIHVDSTGKGSWACFDAVGLTTAAGKTTWATSADCSSVYGGGSLNAQTKKTTWHGLW
ncbi:MAG: hypothetical protein K8R36_17885 [Planctomycetales bacterium]|nr:hypothetical protein [Planctomycetales bacterium]